MISEAFATSVLRQQVCFRLTLAFHFLSRRFILLPVPLLPVFRPPSELEADLGGKGRTFPFRYQAEGGAITLGGKFG